MAMTKEQQKESARRIMEKCGPLDEREQEVYRMLTTSPEDYEPPNRETGERVCAVCGEVFPDLEKFSDHQTGHNPGTAEWSEAYRRMRDARESKKSERNGETE